MNTVPSSSSSGGGGNMRGSSVGEDFDHSGDYDTISGRRLAVATTEVGNGNCLSSTGSEVLYRGDVIIDTTNRFGVMFTITGDLCAFTSNPDTVTDQISWVWTWCLGTGHLENSHVYVDSDGYLRFVTTSGQTYWRSQYAAGSGGMLIMKPNGNLVLTDSTKTTTKWSCGSTSGGYFSLPDFSTSFLVPLSTLCPLDSSVTSMDGSALVCRTGLQTQSSSGVNFKFNLVAVIVIASVCAFVIISTLLYSCWTWFLNKRRAKYDAQKEKHQPYKSFRRSQSMVIRSKPTDLDGLSPPSHSFFAGHVPRQNNAGDEKNAHQHKLFHPFSGPTHVSTFEAGSLNASANVFHNHSNDPKNNGHQSPSPSNGPFRAAVAEPHVPTISIATVVPIDSNDSPNSSDKYPIENIPLSEPVAQSKHLHHKHHYQDTHHHHLQNSHNHVHDGSNTENNNHKTASTSPSSVTEATPVIIMSARSSSNQADSGTTSENSSTSSAKNRATKVAPLPSVSKVNTGGDSPLLCRSGSGNIAATNIEPISTPASPLVNTPVNDPVNPHVDALVSVPASAPITPAPNPPVNPAVHAPVNGAVTVPVNTLVSVPVNATVNAKVNNSPTNQLDATQSGGISAGSTPSRPVSRGYSLLHGNHSPTGSINGEVSSSFTVGNTVHRYR